MLVRACLFGACAALAFGASAGSQNEVVTDNGKFSIELLDAQRDGDLVTWSYEVCNTSAVGGKTNPALSHWVLGLGVDCLAEGFVLSDLVVDATFDGEPLEFGAGGVQVGADPTTGVVGVKFDNGHDDLGCHVYTVTLDSSVLMDGFALGTGDVYAATKAGKQLGYAVVSGPVCVEQRDCQSETAFGGDTAGTGPAWWYYYDASAGGVQTIWAGRTIEVGTVEVIGGTVYITLTGGWELQDDAEAVKVQGYSLADLPASRPAAGRFAHKGTSLTVEAGDFAAYVIHLDVQRCD